MKIMAIDFGDARTGIAISDPTGLLAGHTQVIPGRKADGVAREVASLVTTHGVEELVLGLPRNMDGSEGPRAQICREFAQLLTQETGLTPVLWDERRTTVEAHGILHAGGKKMKRHKQVVDAVAASLILDGYLTRKRMEKAES